MKFFINFLLVIIFLPILLIIPAFAQYNPPQYVGYVNDFANIISPDTILELKLEKSENFITYTYYNDEKKFSSGILPRENLLKGAEYERNQN